MTETLSNATGPPAIVPNDVATKADEVVAQVASLIGKAESLVIDTQDDFENAGELVQRIKGAAKRLEDSRKGLVEPLNHQVKVINAAFKAKTSELDRAENLLKYGVPEGRGQEGTAGYLRRQEERRLELQRIEDQKRLDALREAEERRQAQLAEAAALEKDPDPIAQESAADLRAAAEVVPAELLEAPVPVKTMEKVSGVSMREEWIPEPIEPTSFGIAALRTEAEQALRLLQMLAPTDERAKALADRLDFALRSAVEPLYLDIKLRIAPLKSLGTSMKGAHKVPGITFRKEINVASRAK
jgi:hypothetical protein